MPFWSRKEKTPAACSKPQQQQQPQQQPSQQQQPQSSTANTIQPPTLQRLPSIPAQTASRYGAHLEGCTCTFTHDTATHESASIAQQKAQQQQQQISQQEQSRTNNDNNPKASTGLTKPVARSEGRS